VRKHLPLIAVVLAVFLISLLVLLPAQIVSFCLPASVTVGSLTGSVWNGGADSLVVNGRPLGAFQWHLRPFQLFIGRLVFDGELTSADGSARGWVSLSFGGAAEVRDLEVSWPLATLPVNVVPTGWSGELRTSLHIASFKGPIIVRALGAVEARDLRGPPPEGAAMGSFRLTFDESSLQGEKLVGRLQDLAGPLQVSGTLTLGRNRDYLLEGLVAARGGASDTLNNTLRFLGAPDAQGRRPFSVAGTY
jgi:general secretion pathway protein N